MFRLGKKNFCRGTPLPPRIARNCYGHAAGGMPLAFTQEDFLVVLNFTLQDRPYLMNRKRLGYAIIVNNVSSEMPGSKADVTALKTAYGTVGFDVQIHTDCNAQVIRTFLFKVASIKLHFN